MKFELLTLVIMQVTVSLGVIPCTLLNKYLYFGEPVACNFSTEETMMHEKRVSDTKQGRKGFKLTAK
jgi:hypothetical protein